MTIHAKCAKCGADVELNDNYKTFVEKYPERVTCFKCKKAGGANATKATATAVAKSYSSQSPIATASSSGAREMAMEFKAVYNIFKEVFGDEMKDIHDYVGGWVSTTIIQGKMNKRK